MHHDVGETDACGCSDTAAPEDGRTPLHDLGPQLAHLPATRLTGPEAGLTEPEVIFAQTLRILDSFNATSKRDLSTTSFTGQGF